MKIIGDEELGPTKSNQPELFDNCTASWHPYNSDSIVLRALRDCLLLYQDTQVPRSQKHPPEVDFREYVHPAQSASVKTVALPNL